MAMLHILHAIRTRWTPQLSLEIIHFNHKKRFQSDEEVQLYGIWYHVYHPVFLCSAQWLLHHRCVYVYVCVCVYLCVCVYVCMCVLVCTHQRLMYT